MARRRKTPKNAARDGSNPGRGGQASSSLQNPTVSRTNGERPPTSNGQVGKTIPSVVVSEVPANRRQTQNQIEVAGDNSLAPPPVFSGSARGGDRSLAMTTQQILKAYTRGADRLNKKPAPPRFFVTMYVTLPGPMRGFKEVDPADVDIQTILTQIAQEHQAKVDMDEDGRTIIIKATNRGRTQEVINKIREQLFYQPGEESVWRTQLLIHPPKGGKDYFNVSLQPKAGEIGMRAVDSTSATTATAKADDLAAEMFGYEEKLRKGLNQKARILRHVPNGMRMRVQFGSLLFDEWKKDQPTYNFVQFGGLVSWAARRSTSHMVNSVNMSAVESLRAHLFADDGGIPKSIRPFLNPEAKPQCSIILESKNLHIKTVIDPVQAQVSLGRNARGIQQYTLGPLAVSQLDKQHQAGGIITICPESSYDWELGIRKLPAGENAEISAPFTSRDLLRHMTFSGTTLGGDFPDFSIMRDFKRAHKIQKIYGRTTWTYSLGSWYSLELTLMHTWKQDTPAPPVTTGSVSLYGFDWDDDMRSGVMPPREWDEEFSAQFFQRKLTYPAPGDVSDDRLRHFLAWVHWIQQALDKAPKDAGNSAAKGA